MTMRPWGGITARLYRLQEPLESAAVQTAVSLGQPAADDRALDVATGTGLVLARLARLRQPPRVGVGLDRSGAMLRAARGLPKEYELRQGDARGWPFADDSFDLVFGASLLHLLDEQARRLVVEEVARVLSPGGRVVTVTVWHPQPAVRRLLEAMPTSTGLRPLDPTGDLEEGGLLTVARRVTFRGYPSLILRAQRPSARSARGP